METLQIRLAEEQINDIDRLVKVGTYPNRSEAIRTMLRELESIRETMEIFNDPNMVRQIKQGMKEISEGKEIPLAEVEKRFNK